MKRPQIKDKMLRPKLEDKDNPDNYDIMKSVVKQVKEYIKKNK